MPVYAFKAGQSEAAGGIFVTKEFAPTLQAQNNGSTMVPVVAILMEDGVTDAAEQLSIFSWEEPPASPSVLQDFERDWMTRVATSCSSTLPLLAALGPDGWSGRTSPASCPPTTDGTLAPSSEGWQNSGMGSPTAFLTLNTSDWPSDGSACSLSRVLETGTVPPRFYLSTRACRGILRRAEKRGKSLPPSLAAALWAVASAATSTVTEG